MAICPKSMEKYLPVEGFRKVDMLHLIKTREHTYVIPDAVLRG